MANVFEDLGFTEAEAQDLVLRAGMIVTINREMRNRNMSPDDAAVAFGCAQSRITDLIKGKLHKFSLDELANMIAHAG